MGLPQRQPDWYEVPQPRRRTLSRRKQSRFYTQHDVKPASITVSNPASTSPIRGLMEVLRTTTGILAVASTLAALSLYASNVRAQSEWNQQYRQLERLKQAESQYELDRESLVNSLRVTLENSDLVPLAPERLIQLPAAPARPAGEQIPVERTSERPFAPRGY